MTEHENPRRYTFGAFTLDADERRLKRGDEVVPLARKAFDLLLILVENAGCLQPRDELIDALWPNKVVEEQGLTTRIHAVRRALGDVDETAAFVETVRGIGYRFIAPVTVAESNAPGALAPPPTGMYRHRLWAGTATTLAVLAIVAGALAWHSSTRGHVAAATAANTSAPSIAVLPFENLSANPANAYFAAGVQDEILTRLASLGSLKVISRTSTTHYASRPDDLRRIGRQLGVDTVLEGSVQRAGDQVHVNVQLIDTRTSAHIWAHSYNRKLTDVFAVEGDVAAAIASALQAKLEPAESARLAQAPTHDPQAYLFFLQANVLDYTIFSRNSVADPAASVAQAVSLYRDAVARDPGFALAWARLSILQINAWWFGYGEVPGRLISAEHAAQKASVIAPDLAQAHLAVGYIDDVVHDQLAAALEQYAQALRRLPHDPDISARIAFVHRRQGKWLQALTELRHAAALDPRNPRRHFEIAVTLTELRRYDEANQQLEQALAIEPHDYEAMTYRVHMLFVAGHQQAARKALAQIPQAVDPQGKVSALRFWSAWLSRKPRQAIAALANAPDWVIDAATLYPMPTGLLRGEAQAMQGDSASTDRSYAAARARLQAALKRHPRNPTLWGALGVAEAGLGNADKALDDGRHAVRLMPVTSNAFYGTAHLAMLARISARTDRPEQAVKLLAQLLSMPAGSAISVALLRLDPSWDPIRADPRFQALLKRWKTSGR